MMNSRHWSREEKKIARRAFDLAYRRECSALASRVREEAEKLANPEDLWKLHDLLTEQRKEIDEKYDYRYSVLGMVFGRLIGEGWLDEADLDGLDEEKLAWLREFVAWVRR